MTTSLAYPTSGVAITFRTPMQRACQTKLVTLLPNRQQHRRLYIMHPLTTLSSRILPRMAVPTVQKGRIHATHAPAFTNTGPRLATDQMQTPRPKTKWGLDRDTLYIGGGLAAIGAIWYYYATVENARIEKRRERVTASPANATAPSAKGRGQEA